MIEYRLDYLSCRTHLTERIAEPAPGRIQLLTGPRQVGKTTLLLELAQQQGERAVYAACDAPEAALPDFWERLWRSARDLAGSHRKAVLFLDEIQHVSDWAARLKGEWDRVRRRRIPLHVVATGSSALGLGAGSRESLAGRFERLTLAHWSAAGLSNVFGIARIEAAELLVRLGSYPGAFGLRNDFARWRAYVRDAIIEPAVERDILALGIIRRPALLRQVLALAAGLPAQVVSLQKLQGQLQDPGTLETIAHYLKLLEDAYLIAALQKFSLRPIRRRSAPPKLIALNNALLSAMDPEGPPDPAIDSARYGTWVENACLAHAWNAGQRVTYWREEPLEVDGIVDGSWGTWALEVKTGVFGTAELRGLLEFCRRYPRYRPLVLTGPAGQETARQAGVSALSWTEFLLGELPNSPH
ncbi:MAG: ATP-binding protein [Armatimonadota bacterium]